MLNAGRLRHRLELQSHATTVDSAGQESTAWTTYATVWGSIEPLSGKEYERGSAIYGQTVCRIVIRYRNDVALTHRISHASKVYNLREIRDLNTRNRVLHLIVSEGDNTG